ncbi:MAG: Cu(I)-responsive transcriptional regulator [Casimicrobiaceae bacterium]
MNGLNAYPLNIGDAAKASDVSAKMIRHYEEIGLIPKAKRTPSNYRTYSQTDVHTLRFIRQARALGFSIKQIGTLLGLWRDCRRPSSKVKSLALAHIAELDAKIREMQAMKRTLETLAEHCRGDERPDCPILERLATAPDPAKGTGRARRSRTSTPGLH